MVACIANLVNHQPLFNLVVTNVPGPSDPLYLLGAAMVEVYPFVPLAGNLTIGIAAMSYDDYLSFGILADLVTCPDAATFARGLQDDLDSLAAATPSIAGPPPGARGTHALYGFATAYPCGRRCTNRHRWAGLRARSDLELGSIS